LRKFTKSSMNLEIAGRIVLSYGTCHTVLREHLTMGNGSFPRVKRLGRGIDHAPPSSAEVKERVELYLYSPSGPSWPVLELYLYLHCGSEVYEKWWTEVG
jgi:hypothetical protein